MAQNNKDISASLRERCVDALWPGHVLNGHKHPALPCPKCGSHVFRLFPASGAWTCDGCEWQGDGWKALILEVHGDARWRELSHKRRETPGIDPRQVPPGGRAGEVDAERAVVGCVLLGGADAADAVLGAGLRPEVLYDQRLAEVLRAALELIERGAPVDPVSLPAELQRRGALERVGGVAEVVRLWESVPTPSNAAYYAGIVVECAQLRELRELGQGVIDAASASTRGDPRVALSKLKERVEQLDQLEPGEWAAGADAIAAKIVRFVQKRVQLFRDQNQKPFVGIELDGARQTWPASSEGFRDWIAREWWERERSVAPSAAINGALQVLRGEAAAGKQIEVHTRVARLGDRIYLDLADDRWRAVEITAEGWRVLADPPVRFRRRGGMLALPEPVRGGSLEELRPLLNVGDREWIKCKGWLVQALRGRGPYLLGLIDGDQGSGKSTCSRILRNLVDPNAVPIRAKPKEERDLLIAASAAWVTCLDNLSGCEAWLSDALCRLATGGGFSARQLHTDDEEALFWAVRPTLLNGIDDLATRPDLADRALKITLHEVAEEHRRDEEELYAAFEAMRPRVLGALLDAASCALRRWGQTRLARAPRMADAARWIVAAGPALGIEDEAFMGVLAQDRAEQDQLGAELDPVVSALQKLVRERAEWTSSVEDLLDELRRVAGETACKDRSWPRTPSGLGKRLRRFGPVLRRLGVSVGERWWSEHAEAWVRTIRRDKQRRDHPCGPTHMDAAEPAP